MSLNCQFFNFQCNTCISIAFFSQVCVFFIENRPNVLHLNTYGQTTVILQSTAVIYILLHRYIGTMIQIQAQGKKRWKRQAQNNAPDRRHRQSASSGSNQKNGGERLSDINPRRDIKTRLFHFKKLWLICELKISNFTFLFSVRTSAVKL